MQILIIEMHIKQDLAKKMKMKKKMKKTRKEEFLTDKLGTVFANHGWSPIMLLVG